MKQGGLVGWLRGVLVLALLWLARDLVVPLVQALAWPAMILATLFLFRERLDEILARVPALRKLRAGAVEAEFEPERPVAESEIAASDELAFRLTAAGAGPADEDVEVDA